MSSNHRLTSVIFDLDGTLIDSEAVAFDVWRQGLAPLGVELQHEHYLNLVGQRIDVALETARRMLELQISSDQLLARLDPLWQQAVDAGFPPMAGVEALVETLEQRGIPWGVATATSFAPAKRALQKLNLWQRCKALAGGDEVAHSKPAPDVYLLCAARMNVQPDSCLAIEDSLPGHRAAAAAGMKVVAIPNQWSEPADYDQADVILPSLHAVQEQLDQLLRVA